MRRIASGYRPGIDWQYFHGLGLPYLYYWAFRVFGGDFPASELARELISTLLFPVVLVAFFRAFERDWRRVLCLSAMAFAASFIVRLSALFFALNSMTGVRAALPTLVPAILFAVRDRRQRIFAAGIAIGLSLFLSTEQGLAVTAGYAVIGFVAAARRQDRRIGFVEWAATLGLALVTFVAALTVVAGPAGMRGALHYNLRVVPMDQYWYFGAPPNTFVPSWSRGVQMLIRAWPIGLSIVLAIGATILYVVRFWRMPDEDPGRRWFALAVLTMYGVISCVSLLGVFTPAYSEPCWRVVVLVALLELSGYSTSYDAREAHGGWIGVPRFVMIAALAIIAYAYDTIPLIRTALYRGVPHIIVDHVVNGERFGITGIWPETLREAQQAIDSHRTPEGRTPALWSTYSGWIEARNGIFNPSFDYIIHALGPANRAAYVDTFRRTRPTLVQTVRPSYTQYEPWIENGDWPFYDALFDWYDVSSLTPWSFFWERRTTPGPAPRFLYGMRVPPSLQVVKLPPIPDSIASPVMVLEVDLEYEIHNPLHVLPIVGAEPRYLVGIEGAVSTLPVSLDPYVTRTRFPVIVRAGQRPALAFATASLLPGATWRPVSIDVYLRPLTPANQVWLADLLGRLLRRPPAG